MFHEPVNLFVMLTNVANSLGRWHPLQPRTQAALDQRENQDGDDETRDPEQSDGSLVAELVIESVDEIGGVQRDQDRQ